MHYFVMTLAENDALVGGTNTAIITFSVIIVVNIALWLYYKDQPKIDQGRCFSYFKLSYRRRFKRDFWGIPMFIILLILLYIVSAFSVTVIFILSMILLLTIIQSVYNYKMWKKNET